MKSTFWYLIGLIAGAVFCCIGLSQALSPVPAAPTCNGKQMTRKEVCDRTVNGFKMRYNYDEKLQFDKDTHKTMVKNWGWYMGIGIIFLLAGIYALSTEGRRKRARSTMTCSPIGRPPSQYQ